MPTALFIAAKRKHKKTSIITNNNMTQRFLQKEDISDIHRTRLEEAVRELTSKVKSGILDPQILKYLNLDLGSNHVYSVKGELEKDPEKDPEEMFNYMVGGVSLLACANKDVESALKECAYGDYVKVILAPNSLIVLDVIKQ
jgi:AICAR transformylase/IMP cyclohydrolase PurH